MAFASTSTIRTRAVPLITASTLSISIYGLHSYFHPIYNDDLPSEAALNKGKRSATKPALSAVESPYTPLGWGSNKYLTLLPDTSIGNFKKPTPLAFIGTTPLRHLVLAEKYGACLDARGDCWMWGAGYEISGAAGRSLRGKKLKELVPAPSKVIALSKDGRLYAFAASKALQADRRDLAEQSWWSWLWRSDAGVDYVELKAAGGLKSGEKWTSVSAGLHHVLAVTSKGRAFSLPLSPQGNSHRQLGLRTELPPPASSVVPAEADIRYSALLSEIPSLKGIEFAQAAAGDRTSFVRTPTGRVLGFGANELGQIGLGANAAIEIIQTPVEIVLARNYPGGTTVNCKNVIAGGSTTFFSVERSLPGTAGTFADLLACGNGISGALGNGLWSSASGAPNKVKSISGLQEYSEKDNAYMPLNIHDLSVSSASAPHVFAVLDTVREAEAKGVKQGIYGKDVMVWGGNADYQLGNGKRSSLAVPQHLPPLIERLLPGTAVVSSESSLSSGTLSPMPHSRLQLHVTKTNAHDLDGKLIKRGVKCEETMVAGYNASALYNKIID